MRAVNHSLPGSDAVGRLAGGVKIGEPLMNGQRENQAERNSGNVIADNNIHNLGIVYPAGVGIWLGQSSDNTVSHNHVYDLFTTAISVGWTWSYKPDQAQGNIIEFNHLHNIGQNVLSDMGGIYTGCSTWPIPTASAWS